MSPELGSIETRLAKAGMLAVIGLTGLIGTAAIAAYIWHLYKLVAMSD